MSQQAIDDTGQTIARNAAFLLVAKFLSTALGLVLVLFMARKLGDEQFGIYTIGIACGGISHIFVDLGLNNLTTRHLARHRETSAEFLGRTLLIKLFLAFPVWAFTGLVLILLGYDADTLKVVLIIVANALSFNALQSFFYHVFEGFEQMQYITVLEVVKRLTYMISGAVTIYAGYGVVVFVVLLFVSDAGNLLITWWIYRRKFSVRMRPRFSAWPPLIKAGLPFGLLLAFSLILSSTDVVMIGSFRSEQEAGWYGAAIRLVSTLSLIPLMSASAMFPSISRLFHEAPGQLRSLFADVVRPLVLLAVPVAVGTSMLSKPIILLVFNPEYVAGAPALSLLAWSAALHFLTLPMVFFLSAVDRQVYATSAMGAGALINVVLNFLLIPEMGLIGASITTILSQAVLLIACLISVRDLIALRGLTKYVAQASIGGVVLWAFLVSVGISSLFLVIPTGALIYVVCLVVIRAVSADDWNRCLRLLRPVEVTD